jgi:hypothetical protein
MRRRVAALAQHGAVGRNDLREQGLIRDDTPRSIWEITEERRQWRSNENRTTLTLSASPLAKTSA